MATLKHLHELALRTGALRAFYVFGSFVSAASTPRDIDLALVMDAGFRLEDCPREHLLAEGGNAQRASDARISRHLANQAGRFGSWHIGGRMIRNDEELAVTRERVARLERLLEDLRKTARPEEWPALSSGYRLEIERMQGEILDYLVRAAPDARRTTTA